MAPVKRCEVQYYAAFEQLVVDVDVMEAVTMHSDRIGCDHHQNKTLPKWSSEGLIHWWWGDEHLFLTGVCRDLYDLSVAAEANVAAVEGKFPVDLPWRIAHIIIVNGTCA